MVPHRLLGSHPQAAAQAVVHAVAEWTGELGAARVSSWATATTKMPSAGAVLEGTQHAAVLLGAQLPSLFILSAWVGSEHGVIVVLKLSVLGLGGRRQGCCMRFISEVRWRRWRARR